MKLRNKKTGKIQHAYPVIRICDGKTDICFASLAELNEEWEEFEPKEPLINDEDARDAVFSWASSLQIHQVKCTKALRGPDVEVTTFEATGLYSAPRIEFTSLDADVADGVFYTIGGLCRNEE